MYDDLLRVHGPGWGFYVLRDRDALYLLDCGFLGGRGLLTRALRGKGWLGLPIRGIVITHGHLDHTLHVAAIARETGAWIAAPALDAAHYAGTYPYCGQARVCGVLEGAGRRLFGYTAFSPDRLLNDGDQLDIWEGLVAVHLPGHTDGHMGYYCEARRFLFSADLFASYGAVAHLPPDIFNSNPALIPGSVGKALSLDLAGVAPNHADRAPFPRHLERLRALASSLRR